MPGQSIFLRALLNGMAIFMLAALNLSTATQAQQPGNAPPPQVTVVQPVQKKVTDWDEFTGRFEAVDTVSLRARVSGYITEVHFTDGQLVKQGDLLFVIDPRPFERTVEKLRAELASAKARNEFASKDVERARPLLKNENISAQLFDQRKRDLDESEAAVKASQASLGAAELDLQFTRVTAPISGRISRRMVGVGNYVTGASASGTLLTTIISQDPIHFYFDVSEADYLKYARLGTTTAGHLSGANKTPVLLALQDEKDFNHKGLLDFVDNRIDNATGTLRARAVFDNAKDMFTPGLFARIRLAGSNEYTGLLIPDEAINTDMTNRFVYVVAEDGTVAYKPVLPGPMTDGLRVVRNGIAPTDWVIVKGVQKARPGAKVQPQQTRIDAQGKTAALP